MIRTLAVLGFAISCLLAEEPKDLVEVTNTQRADFVSGGVLRLENSIGELRVEGWDRPDLEITTIKSTKDLYRSSERERGVRELDLVRVSVERQGDDLVIKTDFPRYGISHRLLHGGARFYLQYRIKAPRNTRLAITHDGGGVHVEGVTGDMRVTVRRGEIRLRLPEDGQYAIDASSKFGGVNSDFPGRETHRTWFLGHQLANQASPAAQKVYLRIGFGDILIWNTSRLAALAGD